MKMNEKNVTTVNQATNENGIEELRKQLHDYIDVMDETQLRVVVGFVRKLINLLG